MVLELSPRLNGPGIPHWWEYAAALGPAWPPFDSPIAPKVFLSSHLVQIEGVRRIVSQLRRIVQAQ